MEITVDIIGQLIPNALTMCVQLCSTLVLFLLVKKFLWKPIQNFFAVRQDKMQADLHASEQAREEALLDRAKASEELKEASNKADQIVSAAVKEAKVQKDSILAQANKEADDTKKKAHDQIEADRIAMYEDLKSEMVNIAMDAAGKLIGEKSSDDLDRQAIDAFVKEASSHDE